MCPALLLCACPPPQKAYPVPECYVRKVPLPQTSDEVQVATTNQLVFAPR